MKTNLYRQISRISLIIAALTFCIIPEISRAQTTLEFSQVLLVSALDTVPSGKVWKVSAPVIEKGKYMDYGQLTDIRRIGWDCNASCVRFYDAPVEKQCVIDPAPFVINGDTVAIQEFPIWLPAGTTLAGGLFKCYRPAYYQSGTGANLSCMTCYGGSTGNGYNNGANQVAASTGISYTSLPVIEFTVIP